MKKYAVILLCLAPIILFSTLSCDDNSLPPGLQILYDIVIGEVEYETGGTYSFGSIDAEVGSKSVTLTMTNNGEIALTVTAVSLTASDHFTISHEELPLTVSPGESTDVSVTFNPAATGTLEASLSITLEGITDPFVLNLSGEGNSPYSFLIGGTEYTSGGTYDFGAAEPEGGVETAILVFSNTGETDITVTAVELSPDTHFDIEPLDLPETVPAGETTEAEFGFLPVASGSHTAALSISLEGFTAPFVLNLSGEGNYPPEVSFGIEVSGAGSTNANGIYQRSGETGEGLPLYYKDGTLEFICYPNPDNTFWYVSGNLEGYLPFYIVTASTISPPSTGWTVDDYGADDPPTVSRYDLIGTNGYSGQPLTANYFYFDEDGDLEDVAATSYQWWVSDDQTEPDSEISGETEKIFTPDGSYEGAYIWVEITPAAQTGLATGAAVMSRPTAQITSAPPPVD